MDDTNEISQETQYGLTFDFYEKMRACAHTQAEEHSPHPQD
jgi:hypothetical protein